MKKKKLNKFISSHVRLNFGDYILFQEYVPIDKQGEEELYKVSKPILAIYLGCFVADQTIGFNYVRWNNDRHTEYVTNEYVKNYPVSKQVEKIESHIEWNDYIDILGKWENKPKWREIIKSYREQYSKDIINSDFFDVSEF